MLGVEGGEGVGEEWVWVKECKDERRGKDARGENEKLKTKNMRR